MTPYYDDGQATLLHGDCRDVLASLPAASVHCVVCSPPYLGLRAYSGVEPSVWGGADCEHAWGGSRTVTLNPQRDNPGGGVMNNRDGSRGQQAWTQSTAAQASTGAFCQRCDAWRGHLGMEPQASCGRSESGLLQLRSDLTTEERDYVMAELRKAGLA